MRRYVIILCSLCLLFLQALAAANPSFAVQTRKWTDKDKDKGSAGFYYEGAMYSDKGTVVKGYNVKKYVYKNNLTLWSGAFDEQGSLIVGGGWPAVLSVLKDDKFTDVNIEGIKSTSSKPAYSVIKRLSSRLIGGIMGNGNILGIDLKSYDKYKILSNLPVENTWDLEDVDNVYFYAATGPLGQVFRIDYREGKYEVWAQVPDINVTFVHNGGDGKVYLGGGETGNLYELTGKQKINVVYHFQEEALVKAVDYAGGSLIVAVNKLRKPPDANKEENYKEFFKKLSDLKANYGVDQDLAITSNQRELSILNYAYGSVYLVTKDGRVEKILSLKDEYIFDIQLDKKGRLYIATGPKGKVYMIKNPRDDIHDVWTAYGVDYKNVTSIIMKDGYPGFFLVSGNEAVVFQVSGELADNAKVMTRVLGTGIPADWGKLSWGGKGLKVYSRHGNTPVPDKTWTEWTQRKNGSPVELKNNRWAYGQLRFDIKEDAILKGFEYYYTERNHRPVVKDVKVSDRVYTTAGPQREITWEAADPNGDELIYNVWITEEGKENWINLSKSASLKTSKFTVDTDSLPDGRYVVKVEASDEPSNYGNGLKGYALSEVFINNNERPEFPSLKYDNKRKIFTGKVASRTSVITKLYFSVDGGEWIGFSSSDGILDDKTKEIRLSVPKNLANGHHVISFRAINEAGNQGNKVIGFTYRGK
ncbi:MAG: fibronectin type III domain-containing protein [Nitrospirae bacterium]|nr:fibronectin type III domain-containing protein [Nitrospirota bacterium]